jgi:hypothetical protein
MLENLKWILIVLFCGAIVFVVVPTVVGFYKPDPVPHEVRIRLDRIDLTKNEVVNAAKRAKFSNKNADALRNEQRDYEDISNQFAGAVDVAVRGLRLNSVDVTTLAPALDNIETQAKSLRDRLKARSNLVSAEVELGKMLEQAWDFLTETANGWTKLGKDREALVKYAIDDLNKMKWPQWQSLKGF